MQLYPKQGVLLTIYLHNYTSTVPCMMLIQNYVSLYRANNVANSVIITTSVLLVIPVYPTDLIHYVGCQTDHLLLTCSRSRCMVSTLSSMRLVQSSCGSPTPRDFAYTDLEYMCDGRYVL